MKEDLFKAFTGGFKDSFRLAAYLCVAIVAVIGAFSNHAPEIDSGGLHQNGKAHS